MAQPHRDHVRGLLQGNMPSPQQQRVRMPQLITWQQCSQSIAGHATSHLRVYAAGGRTREGIRLCSRAAGADQGQGAAAHAAAHQACRSCHALGEQLLRLPQTAVALSVAGIAGAASACRMLHGNLCAVSSGCSSLQGVACPVHGSFSWSGALAVAGTGCSSL